MNKFAVVSSVTPALAYGDANAGKILVPAYFYPSANPSTSYWDELTAAASTNSITAIMNPNNGPGSVVNGDYSAAVNTFHGAGGQVVGYIHSSYGVRDINQVKADINLYASFYSMDGFFVDEMSDQSSLLAYYQDVYAYIKALNPSYRVFGNPGTGTLESYLSVADTLVTFEGPPTATQDNPFGYDVYGAPSTWVGNYPADRFGHLIYGVAGADDMLNLLNLAASRNAGYLFITDDTLPNPWDTLPTYWNMELAASSMPAPSTGFLFGTGLALAALMERFSGSRRRRVKLSRAPSLF